MASVLRIGVALVALVGCSSATPSSSQSLPDAGDDATTSPDDGGSRTDAGGAVDAADAEPLPEYEGFEISSAEAEGIDPKKLAALVAQGADEKSSALIVIRNGRLVLEEYYGGDPQAPLVAMSASKSVTSLAAGLALANGKLTSIEQPIAAIVPELAVDPEKSTITVRHLLEHTSGLDIARASGAPIVAHAANSPMFFEPGTSAQYNNNAVDLLAAVVGRAAGVSMDLFLDVHLFGPLGASGQFWMKDPEGVPRGAGELFVRPIDAAKIGQLMLDGGKWHDQEVLQKSWVSESTNFDHPHEAIWDRLWWKNAEPTEVQLTDDVLAHWKRGGVSQAALDKVAPLVGKPHASAQALIQALKTVWTTSELTELQNALASEMHLPLYHVTQTGPSSGYYAAGWLGQYIVVCTEAGIVGVRMRAPTQQDYEDTQQQDGFEEFPKTVCELAQN